MPVKTLDVLKDRERVLQDDMQRCEAEILEKEQQIYAMLASLREYRELIEDVREAIRVLEESGIMKDVSY